MSVAAAAGDADAFGEIYVANDEPTRAASGWMQRERGRFLHGSPAVLAGLAGLAGGELFVIAS